MAGTLVEEDMQNEGAGAEGRAARKFTVGQFDGPLDLLWSLIREQQINIYDIPIAHIVDSGKGELCFQDVASYDCARWVPCHRQREVRSQNEREGLTRAGPQEMFIWTLLLSLVFLDQIYGLKKRRVKNKAHSHPSS